MLKIAPKTKILLFVLVFIFAANYAFADIKTEIYAKLKSCPGKIPFADCNHPLAREIKGYIEAFLEVGLDEQGILIKVAKKYSLATIIDEKSRKEIERKLIEMAGPNRPEIFIRPLSYNLGKVSKRKGKLKLVIAVRNKGKAILTIYKLTTSCHCTTVRIRIKDTLSPAFTVEDTEPGWKVDLAPGEKGELIVITDLNHPHIRLGTMLRAVKIRSNDPVNSLLRVEFSAEITE